MVQKAPVMPGLFVTGILGFFRMPLRYSYVPGPPRAGTAQPLLSRASSTPLADRRLLTTELPRWVFLY